ncbi:MAG: YdiU family protein [Beijerinckiaceae bacterium]|nr:YdiU family protein [Beijerinckiaceae bacterium]
MRFDNSYARLPDRFYTHTPPTAVSAPRMLKFNRKLADELGVEAPDDEQTRAKIFTGNLLPEGSDPLALAYAGHQFGHFNPQLGDGRAVLLGELLTADGGRRDMQLKGSGRTPFSRGGDGRAAFGPVLREYVISEAMHALGAPTTRSLAAAATGERVYREAPLPGAVLTRIAASHLRIGTFQYFAARGDGEAVRLLIDYSIDRHYPHLKGAANPALALFEAVVAAQAALVAKWLSVGFIHGVMNTDNTTISGETIDYGPCAFVDGFDHMAVFSSIDAQGRYAFGNQPPIAQWNLARFAETLLPAIDEDKDRSIEQATARLQGFMPAFQREWARLMRAKLGLMREEEGDVELANDLLNAMHKSGADFTLTFRTLPAHLEDDATGEQDTPEMKDWLGAWRARHGRETQALQARRTLMDGVNPIFIPRNHRVEQALAAATNEDFSAFDRLLEAVSQPFVPREELIDLARPPEPHERVLQTFCGT